MPATIEKVISSLPVEAEKLCDIGDKKYHSIPAKENEAAALVEEDSKGKLVEINAANRSDYPQIVASIKAGSPQCTAIREAVRAKIRERYDVDDEIMMLRIAPSPETALWNDYVEECRAWGREQKTALGF